MDKSILEMIMKANNIKQEQISERTEEHKIKRPAIERENIWQDEDERNAKRARKEDDFSYVNMYKNKTEQQFLTSGRPKTSRAATSTTQSDQMIEDIDYSKLPFAHVFERNDANQQTRNTTHEDTNILEINNYQSRREYENLPIKEKRSEIVNAIKNNDVCIIQGNTGCGKTTQVPQYILDQHFIENKYCNIVVTQPRRIAAISIAHRVCKERNWRLGEYCGYQIALDSRVCKYTRITYVTTGYLQKKLIACPNDIAKYSHIILDEIHERELDLDFVFLVLKILKLRNLKSKLILMSATCDPRSFSNFFNIRPNSGTRINPKLIQCDKNVFTVKEYYLNDICDLEISYHKKEPQLHESLIDVVIDLLNKFDYKEGRENDNRVIDGLPKNRGSVLIFVPGMYEIRFLEEEILNRMDKKNIFTVPLHSEISLQDQSKAFLYPRQTERKIIISTSIAESSITVTDIKYVIDFCLTREQRFDKFSGYTYLKTEWASQSSLRQRSGRVGRVSNGECFRLIPNEFFTKLDEFQEPQIQRAPLEKLILSIKEFTLFTNMEPKEVLSMAMEPPSVQNIETAVLNLKLINALTLYKNRVINHFDGDLTFIGKIMSSLPLDCRATKLILLGHVFGKLRECIILAAALASRSFFRTKYKEMIEGYKSKFIYSNGSFCDFIAIINAYNLWRVQENTDKNFTNRNARERWFEENWIDEKCIKDVYLLKKKIEKHLIEFNICCPEDQDDDKILNAQLIRINKEDDAIKQVLILKLAIAGAYYPYYYLLENVNEESAFNVTYEKDPKSTVVVGGFSLLFEGILYHKQFMKFFQSFFKKDLINKDDDILISYFNSRALIEFKESSFVAPTKIKLQVYLSCFLSVAKINFEFKKVVDRKVSNYLKEIEKRLKDKESAKKVIKAGEDIDINQLLGRKLRMSIKIIHHIECGRFWAQIDDDENNENFKKIYNGLNVVEQQLKQLRLNQISVGKLIATTFLDEEECSIFRARILSIKNESVNVHFVDLGHTAEVDLFSVFELPTELANIPPQAFECELVGIRAPSTKKKYTREANDLFIQVTCDKQLEIELFSVVNNKARVDLYEVREHTRRNNICDLLTGVVEHCAETFQSKHDHYKRTKETMYDSKQSAKGHWVPSAEIDCILNNIECIQDTVLDTIKYPENPLKTKLKFVTRKSKRDYNLDAKVDKTSINCVLLDDEPEVIADRVLVAGEIRTNSEGKLCSLQKTSLMPKIRGLNHIIYMLFAPTLEFRLNREKNAITGALCGLGYNKEEDIGFCRDFDIETAFDVEIDQRDIETINLVRASINGITKTEGHAKSFIQSKNELEELRNMVQFGLFQLLTKKRKPIVAKYFKYEHKWNQIDENLYMKKKDETKLAYTTHRLIKFRTTNS